VLRSWDTFARRSVLLNLTSLVEPLPLKCPSEPYPSEGSGLEADSQDEYITTADGQKHRVLTVTRVDEHHLIGRHALAVLGEQRSGTAITLDIAS